MFANVWNIYCNTKLKYNFFIFNFFT